MPNTYSQIYIQVVFAVKHRNALIHSSWEDRLYKYITGIVQNNGQKMLAINGMPDHLHFFIGMKPSCCLSDLVREVKKSSSTMIKDEKLCPYKFNWQESFGAFSYHHSQIDMIVKYILNQKEHHRQITFKEEYLKFLDEFSVDYDEKFVFEWI